MADKAKKESDQPAVNEPAAQAPKTLGVRLVPANNSDQPVLSNYTTLSPAPGMVFIDFGFLEPAMLAAIPRVAKAGGKLPESLNGRLAVRVAMGVDGVAALHQQLGRLLAGAQAAARARQKKTSG